MRILIDVDGVIADFVGAAVKDFGEVENIHVYNIAIALGLSPTRKSEMESCWSLEGFAAQIQPYDEACFYLAALRAAGFDVVAVTAPLELQIFATPHWIGERNEWLKRIGFSQRDIIFAVSKHFIDADFLVEDNADNANAWALAHAGQAAFLMDRPWNRSAILAKNVHRIASLREVLASALQRQLDEALAVINFEYDAPPRIAS